MHRRVGEAKAGGSVRVDVGEGCTVDLACVCERGFQSYVFLRVLLGVVACLTITCSGRSENDVAGRWVAF